MAAYIYVIGTFGPRALTYVGWTLDLDRRLAEHNGSGKAGAKSTRARRWVLLYAEKHRTRNAAMKREYVLKKNRQFRAMLRASMRQE
jgi:putative endonuclease